MWVPTRIMFFCTIPRRLLINRSGKPFFPMHISGMFWSFFFSLVHVPLFNFHLIIFITIETTGTTFGVILSRVWKKTNRKSCNSRRTWISPYSQWRHTSNVRTRSWFLLLQRYTKIEFVQIRIGKCLPAIVHGVNEVCVSSNCLRAFSRDARHIPFYSYAQQLKHRCGFPHTNAWS